MTAFTFIHASEIVYVLILESMAVMAIVVSFAQKVLSRFVLLIPLLTALSTTNRPIPVIPATLLNKNPASIIMLITLLTELMQLI